MTKTYEIMTIARISLGEDVYKDLVAKIKTEITNLKGKVTKHDSWGKRKFSYEIEKETDGYYDVMEFELDTKDLANLKTTLNYNTNVLRYLITNIS